MNRKQLMILVVLALVVGAAGWLLYKQNSGSWKSQTALGEKLLANLPLNDVAQVTIRQSTNELNLVKRDDLWRVQERGGYPANFDEISQLVKKASELKAVQPVTVGESYLGRLELLAPGKGEGSGTLVEFKDKAGKVLGSLMLGKPHMKSAGDAAGGGSWPDGRHVMIPGKLETICVVSEPFNDVEAKPAGWLNKDFFKLEKISRVGVTHTNAADSWEMSRATETGEWQLAGIKAGEKLDAGTTAGLGSLLASPSFNDVSSSAPLSPATKVQVDTFDGFSYEFEIGTKPEGEDYPLQLTVTAHLTEQRTPGKDEKAADKAKLDKEFQDKLTKQKEKLAAEKALEKWRFTVSKWTIEPLLKVRKDLFEKKPEPGKPAAGGAEIPGLPNIPGLGK